MISWARVAAPASSRRNLIRTLLQAALFWSIFFVVLPGAVFRLEEAVGLQGWRFATGWMRWAGVLLFVVGGSLGLASAVLLALQGQGTPLPMAAPRALVVAGPYRHVRNPMALAGLTQGVAVGLFLGSPAVILYALLGAPVWHWAVRPWEEADLEKRFGDGFCRYRSAVRCWVPSVRGYSK